MTRLYYTLFNFIALSLILYSGVDMFYKITSSRLTQAGSGAVDTAGPAEIEPLRKPPFGEFQIIAGRNLFGSLEKDSGGIKDEDTQGLPPTSLDLTLLGTVAGNVENARAVILDAANRKQGLYKTGDSIQDAVIKKIFREKVVLRVGEKDEVLSMAEPSSSKEQESLPFGLGGSRIRRDFLARGRQTTARPRSTIVVNRADIQAALSDINQLLTQARIQPHYQDGSITGLSVSRIARGSVFSKLGLRNGDVIEDIDGKGLNNPEDIFSLYEKVKTGESASIKVNRRGRQQELSYRFK